MSGSEVEQNHQPSHEQDAGPTTAKSEKVDWNDYARIAAGARFRQLSAEMGLPATTAVVEAAELDRAMAENKGEVEVLDVACGPGEPSLSIAKRLGARGRVTGVDMAEASLKVARERAAEAGLTNISFQLGDVHKMDFADNRFDRVTSRLGVMFFDDPVKALSEVRRVLKPRGKVTLLAWGPMEQPYFDMKVGTILRMHPELQVPETAKKLFRFAEQGSLAAVLDQAGFRVINENHCRLPWNWGGTPEELWELFRAVVVPFRPLLEQVENDRAVVDAVLAKYKERWDGRRVRMDAEMVLATGWK